MRVHVEKKSDTEISMTISANEADLLPIKNHVVKNLGNSVKVSGFREGKAPTAMIEKSINPNTLQQEFLNTALSQLYSTALKTEKFNPVSEPEAKLKQFVPYTTLEVELNIEVFGPITLPDYKTIKLERAPVKVTAAEVEAVIKRLQLQLAEKKDVERASKNGDQIWIDFKGVDDKGEPVNGADGKDYPLLLGSDTFIPGFEKNLVGLKANESKTFTIPFPKDYSIKALQNRKVTFTVDITKVQDVVEPEVNNEFSAKIGPFKSVAELKTDIKKQLKADAEQKAKLAFENELLNQIADKSTVSIPKTLLERQIDSMEQEERQNLIYRGQTWEEHLAEEGVTAEEHRERQRAPATERVKIGLILSEIAEREKVEITEVDLTLRLDQLKTQHRDPAMQAELSNPQARQSIANRLMAEKTIDKLLKYNWN